MFIVAWIVRSLVARNVSTGLAHFIAWATLAIAVLGILWGGWALLKSSVIGGYQAEQAVKQLERQEDADVNLANRQRAQDTERVEMQGAIDNAVQTHPEDARKPVGPGTDAALEQLRQRQKRAAERR